MNHIFIRTRSLKTGVFPGEETSYVGDSKEMQDWETFVEGLFRSNGIDFSPNMSNVKNWIEAPRRAPFIHMLSAILDEMLSDGMTLSDVDLVLLAHMTPDCHLGTSVTNFVIDRYGMKATGFALSDMGTQAPLFAISVACNYLASPEIKKVLLLVADQNLLPYKSEFIERLQPCNSASVALLEKGLTPEEESWLVAGCLNASMNPQEESPMHRLFEKLGTTDGEIPKTREMLLIHGGQFTMYEDAAQFSANYKTNEQLLCSGPFAILGGMTAANIHAQRRDVVIGDADGHGLVAAVLFRPTWGAHEK